MQTAATFVAKPARSRGAREGAGGLTVMQACVRLDMFAFARYGRYQRLGEIEDRLQCPGVSGAVVQAAERVGVGGGLIAGEVHLITPTVVRLISKALNCS